MPNHFHSIPIGNAIKQILHDQFMVLYGLKTIAFGTLKPFCTKQSIHLLNSYVPGVCLEVVGLEGEERNTKNDYYFCLNYVRRFDPGQEIEKARAEESETIANALLDYDFGLLLDLGTHNGQIISWEIPKIVYDNPTENFLRAVSTNLTNVEIYVHFKVRNRR